MSWKKVLSKGRQWIKTNPQLICIIFFIFLAHLGGCLYPFTANSSPSIPKQSITIHTYAPLQPKTKHALSSSIPSGTQKKRQMRKKPNPSKTSPSKTSPSKNRRTNLKKLQEILAKIETIGDNTKRDGELLVPKSIPTLHIDTSLKEGESDYISLLVGHLKNHLELPERGKVRVELTLMMSGQVKKMQVKKMKVLASESQTNQHYLEKHLLTMSFPPFTLDWENSYEKTIIFTFCHQTP